MRCIATVVLLLAMTGLAAIPAQGTAPGRNGQIVYAHFPTLWVANADGTGARKLPWVKRSEASDPDWSPDGGRIAFDRCAVKCGNWTIDADGSNQKRVGPDCLRKAGCQDRGFPSWSPNGKLIAFGGSLGEVHGNRVEYAEIFLMNANGTGVRQITQMTSGKPFAMDLVDPAWSPDGRQLVFAVQNFGAADPPNRRALYIVNVDGSGLRQLTPWSLNAATVPTGRPTASESSFARSRPPTGTTATSTRSTRTAQASRSSRTTRPRRPCSPAPSRRTASGSRSPVSPTGRIQRST